MSPQQWLDRFQQDNRRWSAQARADTLWPLVSQTEFATRWLRDRLERMASRRPGLPPGYSDPALQSLVMLDDGQLHLSLALIDGVRWRALHAAADDQPCIVEFADGWTRLRFLKGEGAELRIYHRDADGTLEPDDPQSVRDGQEFALDNARQSLRLSAVGDDVLLVRLLVRDPGLGHALECDAATGQVLRTRQAQSHEARTQMILSLLRSLARADAIALVADLVATWPAELRWHAVREALVLDSRAGFALLLAMGRDDPDPKLRQLASETRDRLIVAHPQLADGI